MRGNRPLHTEVLRRLDQALPEMHLPHAIDEYARRQRVPRIE